MSAGDFVRSQIERKLAEEGEKTGRDWIFPKLLKGKKMNLSPIKVRIIKSPGKGFRSL
ncbi:MAG: hypothetical protein H8E54_07295 [Candidatus Aminicenantes bacterium]|nr:hypothetical protein [Candidatus Aminicenantes bacterium]